MSAKFKIPILLSVLSLILTLVFPSGSKAEKKFRFGTWTYGALWNYPSNEALMKALADTLKFNYLMDKSTDALRFDALEQENLRIAAQNISSGFTYQGPYHYSHAHYNVWEAEGNEAYTESLNLQHPAGVGSTVVDGGVTSYKVTGGVDVETLIQFGPIGYAQDLGYCGVYPSGDCYPWIEYNASYRVRVGADDDPQSNEAVAILYVAWERWKLNTLYVDTLVIDTLWDNHFPDTINYIDYTLTWNTEYFHTNPDTNYYMCATGSLDRWSKVWGIQLKVYWFGNRDFYIDKVTVYDLDGLRLIRGEADSVIYNHIHAYHQTSSSLDAWFIREEMECLGDEVDCVAPWKYVRSYLADQGDKWAVGSLGIPAKPDSQTIQSFLDLIEPEELWAHFYLLDQKYAHSSDYQGEDSLSLQVHWDTLINALSTCNDMCRDAGIPLTTTLQAHGIVGRDADGDNDTVENYLDTLEWHWGLREPTGYELECMANLALAYGSKGVLYWKYFDSYHKKATVWVCTDTTCESAVPVTDYLHTVFKGLEDSVGVRTERWYCIRDKIGPYMDSLGPIYYSLTWQGAGSSDSLGLITGNFINSIESYEFPDSPYIEVAFFDSGNTDYFMLTNRRCLPEEEQNVTSYINKGGTYLIIDLYEDDTTLSGYLDTVGAIPFTTHLDPGEGKLFKMVQK